MSSAPESAPVPLPRLLAQGVVGGALMGLANLVPGISGGTMLLAAGIYPAFIHAVAEVTRLRFSRRSLLVLAAVGGTAGCAILLLAGLVKALVIDHRWAMYSFFIGLTLGGVPIVKDLLGPLDRSARLGIAIGFLGMAALAVAQASGATGTGNHTGFLWMLGAGLAGASAMILPGISGGYLLLVLGTYLPILSGIDAVKTALSAADLAALMTPLLGVGLPVGVGVLVGIVGVSNALEWLLEHRRSWTLGLLLGLLVGAVAGLYPFQQTVAPVPGMTIKGEVVTAANLTEIDPGDWPTEIFQPAPGQAFGALGLVLAGIGATLGIRRVSARPD